MPSTIPLQPVPSQTLTVLLGTQTCQINLYQQVSGLYCDLYVNNLLIIGGVVCQNLNRIVRDLYLGFIGDLCFWDTQGAQDPDYTGLGGRYNFLYLTPADLAAQGLVG